MVELAAQSGSSAKWDTQALGRNVEVARNEEKKEDREHDHELRAILSEHTKFYCPRWSSFAAISIVQMNSRTSSATALVALRRREQN